MLRGDRVLLVRRSLNQRVAPGTWQCPAGKQEPDETIEQTLARELREETGLDLIESTPLGTTATELVTRGVPALWHQHSFLVEATGGDVVLSHEHSEHRWVPLEELGDFADLSPRVRDAIALAVDARARSDASAT